MMEPVDRRAVLASAALLAAAIPATKAEAFLFTPTQFMMWHSPGCTCCLEWAKRMSAAIGRKLPVVEASNIDAVKKARGVPVELRSCHTAIISGYVVEGHVPPADIQRLIATSSRSIRGLAVPGMPHGAPGMEMPGSSRQPFQVIAFAANGRQSVFASYS